MKWTSDELRKTFLEFFVERAHEPIADSSLIPRADDPTLLFINSGMAPLKPYFTGDEDPPSPNLCNVQRCIRTNDIEEVGDLHHLTFFEMLGSWSIGDYFKDRAIELAYELLVDVFRFDPDRLYATVYAGNEQLGLGPDEESRQAWERVGISRDRIIALGEDNFWGPAGDTGPCGPCTEVFYDMGPEFGPEYVPGEEFDTTKRYIEIWNAGVFMQFNKTADGQFPDLPFPSVDTGCGLERLAMVTQGASSVYDTDLLAPLRDFVASHLGDEPERVSAVRRIADHVRSAAMILSEGVAPSNEGRGYVLRRLIRKSIALTMSAGVDFPYGEALDVTVSMLRESHPDLTTKLGEIKEAFLEEEAQFAGVISRGVARLDRLCGDAPFAISGADAFDLASTYGLPIEVIRELVNDRGGDIDEEGYLEAFRNHQRISRNETTTGSHLSWSDLPSTPFLGWDQIDGSGEVVAISVGGERVTVAREGDDAELLLDQTTFYPQGGGQVGDQGTIRLPAGRFEVLDTRPANDHGVVSHRGRVVEGEMAVGASAELRPDAALRSMAASNHSATHLLHSALRSVLGDHVQQAGSLVAPDRLRFDFSHPRKVEPQELRDIEYMVNGLIRANLERETLELELDEAIARGAHAMFGEKYGDVVRVVRFGDASLELCGGTHVARTGSIGHFRILAEESVAKGTRRIVAVTGQLAIEHTLDQAETLRRASAIANTSPAGLEDRLTVLLERRQADEQPKIDIEALVSRAKEAAVPSSSGILVSSVRVVAPGKSFRSDISDVAERSGAVVLGLGDHGERGSAVLAVPQAMRAQVDAAAVLKDLLGAVGGTGGGSPEVAQGGVPAVADLDGLIESLKKL